MGVGAICMVYLVALSDTWDKIALKGGMNELMNKKFYTIWNGVSWPI
jgi:hypothetical protein